MISETEPLARRQNHGRLMAILAAVIIPIALASVGYLLVAQARNAVTLRQAVEVSFDRRLRLERILSLHQDIETSSRGYALTGKTEFLEPYRKAEPRIIPEFDELDRIDGENPANSRLQELRRLSDLKRAFVRDTITHRRLANAAEWDEGKHRMDAIRAEIARLQRDESGRLATLSARSTTAQNQVMTSAIAILGLLTALLTITGIVIVRTISDRARALENVADLSRRRKAVLDAAMDGIFILNPSGTIESVNRMGARMFGYDETELVRRDVGMLFATPTPIGKAAAYLRQMNLREGEPGELQEIAGRSRDGNIMAADVAMSAVALADGIHYVAIVRDMSERKKIERMKAEFVASVSHELRTPLTSIAGALGLLVGGAAGSLPDRAARLIAIAKNNADRLVRLINDILDIEKIDAGRMVFDNRILRLDEIVGASIEANRAYAERLGVHLAAKTDASEALVWADPDRLMQVLANLISNAAKYSPQGETVEVEVIPGPTTHRISVCDKGPGISAEFATRIFNRFAQADSSDTRQKDGTGLGLAIVREITQRLGGKVSYDSTPGKGAKFHIDLPAARADKQPDQRERVLLCEHDADTASTLAKALAQNGLHCDIVASAAQAIEASEQTTYRVILVDSNLPSGGGIALVRSLRAQPALRDTTVLMISAEAERGAIGSDALRIAEWLFKPLSLDLVIDAVNRAIEHLPAGQLPRVLHIEDDPDIVQLVNEAFDGKANLHSADSIEGARKLIADGNLDLVILDLGLSDGSGLELLPDLAQTPTGPLPVIVFSAQDADPEVAARVQAYLTKSHTPIEQLVRTVIRLARPSSSKGAA